MLLSGCAHPLFFAINQRHDHFQIMIQAAHLDHLKLWALALLIQCVQRGRIREGEWRHEGFHQSHMLDPLRRQHILQSLHMYVCSWTSRGHLHFVLESVLLTLAEHQKNNSRIQKFPPNGPSLSACCQQVGHLHCSSKKSESPLEFGLILLVPKP
jgi:hypothetical protein